MQFEKIIYFKFQILKYDRFRFSLKAHCASTFRKYSAIYDKRQAIFTGYNVTLPLTKTIPWVKYKLDKFSRIT